MGIATYPAVSSPIKSIQRGEATGSGNITITAVNTAKTMVNSFSTGSAGTVAATGTLNAATGNAGSASITGTSTLDNAVRPPTRYGVTPVIGSGAITANNLSLASQSITLNTTSITGGTTDLTVKQNGVYLSNSTTLVASGACRYEVIEYY